MTARTGHSSAGRRAAGCFLPGRTAAAGRAGSPGRAVCAGSRHARWPRVGGTAQPWQQVIGPAAGGPVRRRRRPPAGIAARAWSYPGLAGAAARATWQDRWMASGADEHGNSAWRRSAGHLAGRGRTRPQRPANIRSCSGRAMLALICARRDPPEPELAADPGYAQEPRRRAGPHPGPGGFALLDAACQAEAVSTLTTQLACRRIALIMAAKGGLSAASPSGTAWSCWNRR